MSTSDWERRGNGERPESADYHAIAKGIRKANRTVIGIVLAVLVAFGASVGVVDAIILTNQSDNARTLNCERQAFDQVLNELLHNQPVTAPPTC